MNFQVGHYSFDIKYESAEAPKEDSYIFVQITSKCRDELTLPIQTKCWFSSGMIKISFMKNILFVINDLDLLNQAYRFSYLPYF